MSELVNTLPSEIVSSDGAIPDVKEAEKKPKRLSLIQAWKKTDFRGWILPVGLLFVWWLITAEGWVNTRLIVPPGNVIKVALQTLQDPLFYQGVLFSLGRDISGFVVGSLGGVILGTALGVSRLADRIVGPTFHTVRQISLFAWLPILSSWLGYGELSKLVFISLSTLYPVALGSFEGVRGVSKAHAEVAKVFRFSRSQILFKLILPSATPQIATGLTLGLVYAWVATIGSEFLLANWGNGLGNIVIKGRAAFNIELIIFGMLVIGVVGVVLNSVAARIEAYVLRWRDHRV